MIAEYQWREGVYTDDVLRNLMEYIWTWHSILIVVGPVDQVRSRGPYTSCLNGDSAEKSRIHALIP